MIPFLEHELIKKYFGTQPGGMIKAPEVCKHGCNVICEEYAMAYRVLEAMREPIKSGERYLSISLREDGWFDLLAASEFGEGFHPYQLRLPDQFQPRREKECEHPGFYMKRWCMVCGDILSDKEEFTEKPDPAEKKINALMSRFVNCELSNENWILMRDCIREIVSLARAEGGK